LVDVWSPAVFFFGFWSGAPSLEEASDADTRGGKA